MGEHLVETGSGYRIEPNLNAALHDACCVVSDPINFYGPAAATLPQRYSRDHLLFPVDIRGVWWRTFKEGCVSVLAPNYLFFGNPRSEKFPLKVIVQSRSDRPLVYT